MDFFATVKGQGLMEKIAFSLSRIADALEENNRLMKKQSEGGEKRLVENASVADAAKKELQENT